MFGSIQHGCRCELCLPLHIPDPLSITSCQEQGRRWKREERIEERGDRGDMGLERCVLRAIRDGNQSTPVNSERTAATSSVRWEWRKDRCEDSVREQERDVGERQQIPLVLPPHRSTARCSPLSSFPFVSCHPYDRYWPSIVNSRLEFRGLVEVKGSCWLGCTSKSSRMRREERKERQEHFALNRCDSVAAAWCASLFSDIHSILLVNIAFDILARTIELKIKVHESELGRQPLSTKD